MEIYRNKYFKYKNKYVLLKRVHFGGNINQISVHDDGNGNNTVKKHLLQLQILNFYGSNKQNFDIIRKIYDDKALMRIANEPGVTDMEKNITEMRKMYITAPDTIITSHSIQFGSGEWTAVEQIMTGTFTGVYNMDNIICQPTGNKFEIHACSLIRWNNNRIIEENIYWDNHSFLKQLGILNNPCSTKIKPVKYTLADKIGFASFGRGDESDQSVRQHLILFENLNFNGYNKRNWNMVHELYDKDAILIFQSGMQLKGIDQIIKFITTGIRDNKVVSIPIHFGSGDWTAASIILTGTLESGKSWAMEHCSLIKWRANKIVEEHSYWDNREFSAQTGTVLDI